jgi:uncharacterized surface protein with fasciclin (FAS1) repeats
MFRAPLTRVMAVAAVLALLAVPIAAQAAPGGKPDGVRFPITKVAKEAGTFNTLLTALKAANLYGTLTGQGPFTVFAPTDEAFAKLPAGTVEALLADPMQLKQILLYHVVEGEVPASTVVGLTSAATLNGQSVDISVMDGKVYLNGTTLVIATDVMARNGIIHVIDSVLLPR